MGQGSRIVRAGVKSTAQSLVRSLTPYPFVDSPWQWGVVSAVHPSYSTSLAASASAGATTVTVSAVGTITPGAIVVIGTVGYGLRVTQVSGSTLTLFPPLPSAQSSGAAVSVLNTLDLYLDGSQQLGSPAYLTYGVRYLSTYSPTANDVVLVARGIATMRTDRVVLGKLA